MWFKSARGRLPIFLIPIPLLAMGVVGMGLAHWDTFRAIWFPFATIWASVIFVVVCWRNFGVRVDDEFVVVAALKGAKLLRTSIASVQTRRRFGWDWVELETTSGLRVPTWLVQDAPASTPSGSTNDVATALRQTLGLRQVL